jgi:hypothetical protein
MYDTLKGEFKNVLVVPGERVYYVASDGPLSYDIAGKLNERRIETKYVNANYLKGVLTEERIRNFIDSIQNTGEINSDFKPVVYSNYLERTARQFNLDLRWLYLLLAVIMLVVYMNLDSIQLSIFNFGFSGVVLEVAVLVFFQIIYGFVYGKIGLLVTFFMAGLALGAYHTTHKHASIHADKNLLEKTVGGMTACSILIPVFSYVLSETASSLAANVVFPLFTLVVGLLVGAAFPLACRLYKSKDASTLYALDLFGAFTGSVAASALLIPALGVVGTCILAGLLNALILAKLKLNKGI